MKKKAMRSGATGQRQPREASKRFSVAAQGAAALALGLGLAAPAPAEASIVYVNIDEEVQGIYPGIAKYDLFIDGQSQLRFSHTVSANYGGSQVYPTQANGGIVGGIRAPSYYSFAYHLSQGEIIGPSSQFSSNNNWVGNGILGYVVNPSTPLKTTYGDWPGQGVGFLGFKFEDDGGNLHYAWARLELDEEGAWLKIFDYAYETDPDKAIVAGAGAVPLPSSLLLLGTGALGVLAYRRRRQNQEQQPD